jgi:hypothetical protein
VRVANQWETKVGYVPRDFGGSSRTATNVEVAATQPLSGSAVIPTLPLNPIVSWFHQATAGAFAAALVALAFAGWTFLQGPTVPESGPIVIAGSARALEGAAVERFQTLDGALKFAAQHSPASEELARDFYERGGRTVIGRPSSTPPVFLPIGRRGVEHQWKTLVHEGLGNLHLYEIHLPSSMSPTAVTHAISHWAVSCGVPRDLIERWSSFRRTRFGPLINECHAGGTCVVIAESCRAAFADLNP